MPPQRKKKSFPPREPHSDDEHFISLGATEAELLEKTSQIKSLRAATRKDIEGDYDKTVDGLKSRITKHYQQQAKDHSDLFAKRLSRLGAAADKLAACEAAIVDKLDSLRKASSELAIALEAIYIGRKAYAQSKKTSST